ncbi:MAG TPA: ATP-binding cassette domain-containing protein [Aestuariivirga sp.]|jgi:putative thiamine transport system ATP-binding protein|nr:ATP-binding cassette domain-containing protein [Hyphomicrobiales bacterium]HQX85842.1 ATP-binding cassette domain-containing protein [Aestuariivirga sp.]MBP9173251.1 ATP-binding cassette domain-containing protein [Hyphomicrobiales bacterium]MCC7481363.1 ATP-binding cassette domain-containing protein [Hyphomicrobiales bacterium]HQY74452.1 ATP-binding cassette domain-containing protein [Aestuariivirga sp.]
MTLLLENISLTIGDVLLVKSFTISIEAGEIVTLMGPSGCGKSSLLAYIAGDLSPPMYGNGHVTLDGVDLVYLPAEQRHVGRLFQDDLLFPHLTVGENLLFGVPRGSLSKRQHLVSEALASAQLEGFEDRDPGTLSSGQRARVALFRALMAKPKAMLLDEPFSKLDAELRHSVRNYVFAHLRERQIPTLLVTHDREDAPAGGRVFRISNKGDMILA